MLKCGRARHKPELHGRHSASGNASQLETRAAQTAYRLPPPRESACGECGENHPPEKHNVTDNNPATNPGQRPLRLLSPVAHAQGGQCWPPLALRLREAEARSRQTEPVRLPGRREYNMAR